MTKQTDFEKKEHAAALREHVGKVIVYGMLTLWALLVLFPFYWMVLTSVKDYGAYNAEFIPKFFTLSPTFANYIGAFQAVPLARYFVNTIIYTLVTTAVMLVVIVPAAFAFARLQFRGKDLVFTLFLALMMIPSELVIITNFVTVTNLDLRNSFTGLILPSVASVFYIYLLKENFAQIPDQLYYAAKADGTSDLKYLFRVMIPIAKPTIVTITILKVIECWIRLAASHHRRCGVLSRIGRHSGDPRKRIRTREHSRHDGGGGRHFGTADPALPPVPG